MGKVPEPWGFLAGKEVQRGTAKVGACQVGEEAGGGGAKLGQEPWGRSQASWGGSAKCLLAFALATRLLVYFLKKNAAGQGHPVNHISYLSLQSRCRHKKIIVLCKGM